MSLEKSYDGIAWVSEKETVPFHFEKGVLELFLGNAVCSLENGSTHIVGQKREMLTGGYILFHFPLCLENFGVNTVDETGAVQNQQISMGTVRQDIDFYIDGYDENSKYTQMRFSFPELDYFIPSSKMCAVAPENNITFIRQPEIIENFVFRYKEVAVSFSLRLYSTARLSNKSIAETKSELLLEFEETTNIEFLLGLFHIIHDLFSFICNRQNISLDSAVIIGTRTHKELITSNGKTEIGDKTVPTSQTLVISNKYKEAAEKDKVIAKTIRYSFISSAFEKLFKLFVDDKVSVLSVHSSVASRNLLNLKQCLHITAAFEYYQRTFLPEITSEATIQFYEEMKSLIQTYANEHTGKLKQKAKSFIKTLTPAVSLKDKICKVFNGYSGWCDLKNILSEWFGDNIMLADIANVWRNELAHEKREYEPDKRVISSIRLVEHLNYCIILRSAGFTDVQIKSIIENILTR